MMAAKGVSRDPLRGGLFENLVVMEALKARYNMGQNAKMYYMRDRSGVEVDLVLENGRQLSFIEIKSGRTPNEDMAANIRAMRKSTGSGDSAYVIYAGEPWPMKDGNGFINYNETAKTVRS